MARLPTFSSPGSRTWMGFGSLAVVALIITMLIPKGGRFKYTFEMGQPWAYEDLRAPFSFPVLKSEAERTTEIYDVKKGFQPYYRRNVNLQSAQKNNFITALTAEFNAQPDIGTDLRKTYLTRGLGLLNEVFERGIIVIDTSHIGRSPSSLMVELVGNKEFTKPFSAYYSLNEARGEATDILTEDTLFGKSWFIRTLTRMMIPNITYEKDLSEQELEALTRNVSPNRGMVSQNELIISKGVSISPERYQKLYSLGKEYENQTGHGGSIGLGYALLTFLLFGLYGINLLLYQRDVLEHGRSMALIMVNVLLFVGVTLLLSQVETLSIWLIPYCMVPIILLAFFGVRLAIVTHLLVVLLSSLVVANPFEFIMIQTLAGFSTILSLGRIRYITQFFLSNLLIFFTYAAGYISLSLLHSTGISGIEWAGLLWLAGNFVLTLLAYLLIVGFEKLFGFVSDISLLELSDVHSKVLKELALRAPGTFQHSLQVASLAEAVIERIGGNSLLTRVGALYHDIGKIYNPEYFIENQRSNYNPHDELTDVQSAEMIIGHVEKGVILAQENRLPRKIIDFIRTHHGTTRVDYFYKHYLEEHENEEVDESRFRYAGPKPSSKETAVVMISDSVEAASRSLKGPDEAQIDKLVDRIIDHKIQDNQFDYATITIQEINMARRVLKKLIKSNFHIRIQYPTLEPGKGAHSIGFN